MYPLLQWYCVLIDVGLIPRCLLVRLFEEAACARHSARVDEGVFVCFCAKVHTCERRQKRVEVKKIKGLVSIENVVLCRCNSET